MSHLVFLLEQRLFNILNFYEVFSSKGGKKNENYFLSDLLMVLNFGKPYVI